MKTIAYLDGYNLYYGRLKHTPYKWLDLFKLFGSHILPFKAAESELALIKYYTAEIKAKFSRHGQASHEAQGQYHRALRAGLSGPVQIESGYYSDERSSAVVYGDPPNLSDRVDIWRLEEKQTDVCLALDIYRDVLHEKCQQIVLCTNDNDLEPALKRIKGDFPHIKVGVVIPRHDPRSQKGRRPRPASGKLTKLADWHLPHIIDSALQDSQFPEIVPSKRAPARKPEYW